MRRLLFAVALIAFAVACKHKPTPEEIAKQRVIDARRRVDSILNSHIAIDYSYIDGWGARVKDTSLDNRERSAAMDNLREYFYDYLVYMYFIDDNRSSSGKYIITIAKGYPPTDSLLALEKDYLNQQWRQNFKGMLYRQSLMLTKLSR